MRRFFVERLGRGFHAQLGHHTLYCVYENTFSDVYIRVLRFHLHLYKKAYRPTQWRIGREDWGTAGKQAWGIETPWFSFYP